LPHLVLADVSARYGAQPVLHHVDLTVEQGEIVCLIGPSGSGKSTLLRVLAGLLKPEAGRVVIAGQPVDYGDRRSLGAARERLAIVFQQYNLFQNMTALRNVTIAPTIVRRRHAATVETEAKALLDKVGLAEKHQAYPDQLSGGQQQRVAIARALALKPEILLLDEVTSALDPELVTEVLDTIRVLAREGMTMLMVSHEMALVREIATKVVFMAEGRIVEQGPPAELFDRPKSDRAREFTSKILRH
jgi:polar amino acid transport system ATP-binding protein